MITLYRHVFLEWLKVFLLSIGAILGVLLLEDLFNNLKDLIDFGASFKEILWFYAVFIPSLLPAILPLSFMISILFSLGQLHRNNEITAMRCAGINLFRIALPIWTIGLVLTATLFWLNAAIVPWSVENSRTMWDDYAFHAELEKSGNEDEIGLVKALCFYNHKDGRLWFINKFSSYNLRTYGVTVHEINDKHQETGRIMASSAYYDDIDGHWVFNKGREITFDPDSGDPIRSRSFEIKTYKEFHENPQLMMFREKKPDDLSLFQLRKILTQISSEDDPGIKPYEVRYNAILATPISCLIVVGIGVPFAVAGVRVNPMVGISKSLGLFFLYYLLASIFGILGSKQLLPTALAAWLPNILMLSYAFYLNRKVD